MASGMPGWAVVGVGHTGRTCWAQPCEAALWFQQCQKQKKQVTLSSSERDSTNTELALQAKSLGLLPKGDGHVKSQRHRKRKT